MYLTHMHTHVVDLKDMKLVLKPLKIINNCLSAARLSKAKLPVHTHTRQNHRLSCKHAFNKKNVTSAFSIYVNCV